jgi:hypothetical protein
LSGYPFYPSLAFDWFNPDWKADHKKTTALLHFIKYFNRVNTGLQPMEYTETLAFPKWIVSWFRFMFTYDKIIFIPGMIGLLAFPFLAKRNPLFSSLAVRFFVLVIGMQLILWFLVAPDPRFIYGCLLAGICILIFSFQPADLTRKFKPSIISIFLAGISILVGGYAIFKLQSNPAAPGWVTPKSLPGPGLQTVKVDGVTMYIPEKIGTNWNPRCYDTDLPCLYLVDPRIKLREKTIKGGFRLSP